MIVRRVVQHRSQPRAHIAVELRLIVNRREREGADERAVGSLCAIGELLCSLGESAVCIDPRRLGLQEGLGSRVAGPRVVDRYSPGRAARVVTVVAAVEILEPSALVQSGTRPLILPCRMG